MSDRFPGYDVLNKRDTASWNEQTRRVVDARLALSEREDVLSGCQLATLDAVTARIVPQPVGRTPVNTVAILLDKLARDDRDGFRPAGLPPLVEAWTLGLDAFEVEAQSRHEVTCASLTDELLDELLRAVAAGDVTTLAWGELDPGLFWKWRMIPDLVAAYYAHPSAWSAMGFGGPASPRGYVRLEANRRDPWEANESGCGYDR